MKTRRYKFLLADRSTKDNERAVLPAIMYASVSESSGLVTVTSRGLTIGWWAWGIGIMQTTVRRRK